MHPLFHVPWHANTDTSLGDCRYSLLPIFLISCSSSTTAAHRTAIRLFQCRKAKEKAQQTIIMAHRDGWHRNLCTKTGSVDLGPASTLCACVCFFVVSYLYIRTNTLVHKSTISFARTNLLHSVSVFREHFCFSSKFCAICFTIEFLSLIFLLLSINNRQFIIGRVLLCKCAY